MCKLVVLNWCAAKLIFKGYIFTFHITETITLCHLGYDNNFTQGCLGVNSA